MARRGRPRKPRDFNRKQVTILQSNTVDIDDAYANLATKIVEQACYDYIEYWYDPDVYQRKHDYYVMIEPEFEHIVSLVEEILFMVSAKEGCIAPIVNELIATIEHLLNYPKATTWIKKRMKEYLNRVKSGKFNYDLLQQARRLLTSVRLIQTKSMISQKEAEKSINSVIDFFYSGWFTELAGPGVDPNWLLDKLDGIVEERKKDGKRKIISW